MIEAATISPEEEQRILDEWFATVQFDESSEGIPKLEKENDDESRSLATEVEQRELTPSDLSFDELMAELRKRDPDNPF